MASFLDTYPDTPLMIATGMVGVWFLVIGLRAAFAEWREKHPARTDVCEQEEREAWEAAVAVRRDK